MRLTLPPTRPALLLVLIAAFAVAAPAQEGKSDAAKPGRQPVIVSAGADRVRFAAPNRVVRLRLEVLSASGEVLFDSNTRGNVLDWSLSDAQGNRLADGQYLCVLTVKDVAGRLTQRLTLVDVGGPSAAARAAAQADLTAGQAQAVGPVESEALDFVTGGEAEPPAATLLAHDGRVGQVVSTSGALSFRLGDFFAAKDKEVMRLSEKGLVVAGDLRATGLLRAAGGVELPDGTVLRGAGGVKGAAGAQAVAADLTVDGNIVFTSPGQVNYGRDIRLSDNLGGLRFFGTPTLTASPAGAAIQFFGNGHTLFPGQAFVDSGAHNSAAVIFRTAGTGQTIAERMRISAAGNVGVGTNAPSTKLDVAGSVNATTDYRIGGQPVLGVYGSDKRNTVVGVGAGHGAAGSSNSFFGRWAGEDTNSGQYNSFFGSSAGGSNTSGEGNSFFGLGAGHGIITGAWNTILGLGGSGASDVSFATAVGQRAMVTQSNSLVLGSIRNVNNCQTSFGCDTTKVGIGTTAPSERLHVVGNGLFDGNLTGTGMLNAGGLTVDANTLHVDATNNRVGVGTTAPAAMLDIQGGGNNNGDNDRRALAFSWYEGGYRHWLRTRHYSNPAADGNAIDFFLNSSATAEGSSAPGAGSLHVMTLEGAGGGKVGINTTSPQSALHVNGYVQLALTAGAPPAADCDSAAEYGRMKVDAGANKLYACTAGGWRSTLLVP